MPTRSLALSCLAVLCIAGCQAPKPSGTSVGPQDATGDTPVRYVICTSDGGGCFVQGRFADIEACNSYRKFSSMLCDSVSVPGQTTCTPAPKDYDSIAAGQCVQ